MLARKKGRVLKWKRLLLQFIDMVQDLFYATAKYALDLLPGRD